MNINDIDKIGELADQEKTVLRAAIRAHIKSCERNIRLHQTAGRTGMAEIYLEEGRILQSILMRI